MDNPFEYSKPLPPRDMVGRDDELDAISDHVVNTHNCRLVGPRRYGKTTLINAALARARDEGLVAIKVSFLGVLTLDDVAERIERAYGEQLDGPLKRWLTGVLRTMRPTFTAGGGPVPASLGVHPQASAGGLLERLALPEKVVQKHGKLCVIAFDEFQDVLRAAPNADAVIRSQIEGHAGIAGYIFSGSHVGMMGELFTSRRRAFYGQASEIGLQPLAADKLADYIAERFERYGRDPGDALAPLLDLAEGHPQRAVMLANKLFAQTARGSSADGETWGLALAAASREAEPEVLQIWSDQSATGQRLLAVVADGGITLNGREARERYGLLKTGSNRRALQQLADEALVAQASTRSGWRIVDPLLGLWLRSGRRWP